MISREHFSFRKPRLTGARGSPRLRCFTAPTPLPPCTVTVQHPSAPTETPKGIRLRQKINATGDGCLGQRGTAVTAPGSLPSPGSPVPWGGARTHGMARRTHPRKAASPPAQQSCQSFPSLAPLRAAWAGRHRCQNPRRALKIDAESSNNPPAFPPRHAESGEPTGALQPVGLEGERPAVPGKRCRPLAAATPEKRLLPCSSREPSVLNTEREKTKKQPNKLKPSHLAAQAAGRAPCTPRKGTGVTLHGAGHRIPVTRWMLIQGPAPSDKEVPRQGLLYEPPSNEAGLNYSSSHAVVFFLVTGSEEAARHGGTGGDPLLAHGTGEANPGNSDQIQHRRPTEGKVLGSGI